MKPGEAIAVARERAVAARERGAYADDLEGFRVQPADLSGLETLLDWAIIEPDISELRSTRRLGAPITLVKQTLYRALRQYNGQVLAQQTRFNLMVAMHIAELSDRVTRLEERSAGPGRADHGPR